MQHARDPRDPTEALWQAVTAVVGVIVAGVGLALSRASGIGPYGLITALDVGVLLGSMLIAAALVWSLVRSLWGARMRWALLGAYVVVLHGSPTFIEAEPRFPVAWLHLGFVDYIAATGDLLPKVDARFNWPGFFTTAALMIKAAGLDPQEVLRWTPVVAELLIVALVVHLSRALRTGVAVSFGVGLVYASFDWVGQTYFSPQTLGVVLLLTALVLATSALPRAAAGRRRAAGMDDRADGDEVPEARPTPGAAWVASLAIVLLAAAAAGSHQMTPIMLSVDLAVLVIGLRVRPRVLPWIAMILTVGWIVFMAKDFWSGHLGAILGDFGKVDSVLQTAVSDRVAGSSPARSLVLAVRGGITVVVGLLAVVGLARRWRRRRRVDWTVVVLAGMPGTLVAMQSYGGEIMLRVLLFSLPALAIVAMWAFAPRGAMTGRAGIALVLVTALVIPAFFIARYGNEAYEQVQRSDVQGVDVLYRSAAEGSTIYVITPSLPWRFERYNAYDYRMTGVTPVAALDPTKIRAALQQNEKGTWLMVTSAQIAELEENYGLESGFGGALVTLLDHQPWLKLVYSNQSVWLYELVGTGTS